jgi:hypothetical protein
MNAKGTIPAENYVCLYGTTPNLTVDSGSGVSPNISALSKSKKRLQDIVNLIRGNVLVRRYGDDFLGLLLTHGGAALFVALMSCRFLQMQRDGVMSLAFDAFGYQIGQKLIPPVHAGHIQLVDFPVAVGPVRHSNEELQFPQEDRTVLLMGLRFHTNVVRAVFG